MIDLPPADRTRLPGSPLELVVCQVRFEASTALNSGAAREFYAQIGGPEGQYPSIEPYQSNTLSLVAGPNVPPSVGPPQVMTGWRFASPKKDFTVSLQPDMVSVETTAYSTWDDDFAPRFAQVVDAVAAVLEPGFEQRLGLRFIDRITGLGISTLSGWSPYLTPELLGLAMHATIGPAVAVAREQVVLELGDGLKCNLGHGFLPSESDEQDTAYLLDFDVFRDAGRLFDADDIKQTADRLDDLALRLFYACIKPDLVEYFKEPRS